jgi:hypothetical protein
VSKPPTATQRESVGQETPFSDALTGVEFSSRYLGGNCRNVHCAATAGVNEAAMVASKASAQQEPKRIQLVGRMPLTCVERDMKALDGRRTLLAVLCADRRNRTSTCTGDRFVRGVDDP